MFQLKYTPVQIRGKYITNLSDYPYLSRKWAVGNVSIVLDRIDVECLERPTWPTQLPPNLFSRGLRSHRVHVWVGALRFFLMIARKGILHLIIISLIILQENKMEMAITCKAHREDKGEQHPQKCGGLDGHDLRDYVP